MQTPRVAKISEHDRVPIKEKLAYGAGGISGALQTGVDASLLNPVFVVTLGVSPAVMSLLTAFYRLWDAVTDMLMGWLSDNTRSRYGRRRPYMFVGAILCGLFMPVIWLLNPTWSTQTLIVWMVVCQLGLYLFATIWNIPYQSLFLEITPDSNERTNVAVVRQYIGSFAWLAVGWTWYFTQSPIFSKPDGNPDIFKGAFYVSLVAAGIVVITGVLPSIFCRERYYKAVQATEKVRLLKNIQLTFSNRPFQILAILTLLFVLGTQAKGGLSFFVRLYYVCVGDQKLASHISGIETTLAIILGVVGIPIFQWLANRFGKRLAVTVIMATIFCASISTLFTYIPNYPYLSMVSGLLLAPANSAIWVLIPSMAGDIVDHDELHTHERREGAFAAIFSWVYKLAISMALASSGLLVEVAGFDAKLGAAQSGEVLWKMRLLLVMIPAVLVGAAIFLMYFYKLNAARMIEIRAQLEKRRGFI